MKFPRRFEATTSRDEFVRLLSQATGDAEIFQTGEGYGGSGWRLRLVPIPPLVIGSIKLERHQVEIDFDGLDAEQQEAFMRRFTQHYQRGGG